MSSVEINQVLSQMRVMSAQLQNTQPVENTTKTDFSDILAKSINSVNDVQAESGRLKKAFELGDPQVDIAQVMIASQKSGIAFNAMVEVRNKVVEAYKDVMNMPV